MSKANVYVEIDGSIERMLRSIGAKITDYPSSADVIFLSGGSDVSPHLYNEENTHSATSFQRDEFCLGLWKKYGESRKFAGICRGAQFISVMLGGKMCQHMLRHGDGDYMHGVHGADFQVNSCHHQGIMPHDGIEIIHSGPTSLGFFGYDIREFNPVESFKSKTTFAVQWHPEFIFDGAGQNIPCVEWFLEKMREFLK